MNLQDVLKAIDDAVCRYQGDEHALLEALDMLAHGWQMRLRELEDEPA